MNRMHAMVSNLMIIHGVSMPHTVGMQIPSDGIGQITSHGEQEA